MYEPELFPNLSLGSFDPMTPDRSRVGIVPRSGPKSSNSTDLWAEFLGIGAPKVYGNYLI